MDIMDKRQHSLVDNAHSIITASTSRRKFSVVAFCLFATLLSLFWFAPKNNVQPPSIYASPFFDSDIQPALRKCAALREKLQAFEGLLSRDESDRLEYGTNATLIKDARIWTGRNNGSEIIRGHVLLEKGIIKRLGDVEDDFIRTIRNLTVVHANGAWLTPGLVDIHSHAGLLSIPFAAGSRDASSSHGPVVPWLQSIDGFNTHDEAFTLAIAGGVTSIMAAPGDDNVMAGEAFVFKMRRTSDGTPLSMLIDPSCSSEAKPCSKSPWRQLKLSVGESVRSHGNRMDTIWALRNALQVAQKVKLAQDEYCDKLERGRLQGIDHVFPEDQRLGILVEALRGRTKNMVNANAAVDLDALIRLSREFKLPIALFQGAAEAYLIPQALNRTWGGQPTIALNAARHRYTHETYRGSEFAPRILADAGIPVAFKSDHPHTNSRFLLHEAQLAHHFGLPANLSLAGVTSAPARAVGFSHRIGVLAEGADADVVLWDAHPLQLGATPVRVWIDGVPQLNRKVTKGDDKEGSRWASPPHVPDWFSEREEAVACDGLPPLRTKRATGRISFGNAQTVWTRGRDGNIEVVFPPATPEEGEEGNATVVVEDGHIVCVGSALKCLGSKHASVDIDLRGGAVVPGLMSVGAPLGVEEIAEEPSTGPGVLYDAFLRDVPEVMDDLTGIVPAMDALVFGTRNALIAHRSGVTIGTSSLMRSLFSGGSPVIAGLSTTFRTGAMHAMERGAVVQSVAALHVAIGKPNPLTGKQLPSVAAQIVALRRLLNGWADERTETGIWFKRAAEGVIPLVVEVNSADIMASLLILKTQIEEEKGSTIRLVFSGATEAHLLAPEIGRANVGVILNPAQPFPATWDDRRILPGPPLSNDTAILTLIESGVTVGIGVREGWAARNTRFDVGHAIQDSRGRISALQAHALASTNLERLLGVRARDAESADLVAYAGGGPLDYSSAVAAVISPQRGFVDLIV
ncbi:hypothetical protein HGRIS_009441 [Hohenbuehelia grisea]|uniref:Amidohydrolase-related domain-containing protein n=1 Tax=Hohenbuehelia grisea TaxID=104357 RepID=A0ABR3J152_9AGAR